MLLCSSQDSTVAMGCTVRVGGPAVNCFAALACRNYKLKQGAFKKRLKVSKKANKARAEAATKNGKRKRHDESQADDTERPPGNSPSESQGPEAKPRTRRRVCQTREAAKGAQKSASAVAPKQEPPAEPKMKTRASRQNKEVKGPQLPGKKTETRKALRGKQKASQSKKRGKSLQKVAETKVKSMVKANRHPKKKAGKALQRITQRKGKEKQAKRTAGRRK